MPVTVQAILAARIDRLPPEEKSLLQTASVIGKDVPFWLLEAAGERDRAELHGQLAHLQTAEFVYEANLFPDLEYTFKHALTHEVAYGSLFGTPRRALHAHVGALEQLRSVSNRPGRRCGPCRTDGTAYRPVVSPSGSARRRLTRTR